MLFKANLKLVYIGLLGGKYISNETKIIDNHFDNQKLIIKIKFMESYLIPAY